MDMVIREKTEIIDKEEKPKRIVSLDILRGIAIVGVTLVHISYKLYDQDILYDQLNSGEGFPFYTWILIGVFGYFGTWQGFFLLISTIVHSYKFTRNAYSEIDLRKILLKKLLTGIVLIVIGYLVEGFGYWGYFGKGLRSGSWDTFSAFIDESRDFQILQIIGLSLVINSTIQYFMFRQKGFMKYKRNMLIFTSIVIVVLVSTPFINFLIDTYWNDTTKIWPSQWFPGEKATAGEFFLTILSGPKTPLFPYIATASFGSMIGMYLGRPKPEKRTLTWFSLAGVGLFLIGIVLMIITLFTDFKVDPRDPFSIGGLPFSTIEEPPSISTFLVQLGGQICLPMILFRIIEFRGKGQKYANGKVWSYFRRWSYLSLTIYSLQILEILPRAFLTAVFTNNGVTTIDFLAGNSVESIWLMIPIILFCYLFFEAVVIILYSLKFVGSLEWFFSMIFRIFSNVDTSKISSNLITNNIEWVDFRKDKKLESTETTPK